LVKLLGTVVPRISSQEVKINSMQNTTQCCTQEN